MDVKIRLALIDAQEDLKKLGLRVSRQNKYCFKNSYCDDDSELLDEIDKSHYEVSPDQTVTVFNRESSEEFLGVDADNDDY
uniref:Uncharacterized protein n=1 Tax=Daphnia galeata TaxID=27404 RepID=A0A8J2RNG6_9CRUS|nr:unnamed protein product [Daphnia galeata]